ncbi:hypothetical protein L7750_13835 [Xenorhabdus bovienii]|uniref:hypothetical protein n=1 Tax=Xenorhabdus bovienii TaxID=40576 RepID=UPI001EE14D03|nr:hypothetical protein [Xenorhabdus bovienii]MCG3461527.1 hypothetical protein [Xenorhabdus bovienii]MCG3471441.1 hypothetical protein [Xenorhabdus bovienii]
MPEHIPPLSQKELGITGHFRFRKQALTSRPVLQVEVLVRKTRLGTHSIDRTDPIWRDATLQEAVQIQYGTGFIDSPES